MNSVFPGPLGPGQQHVRWRDRDHHEWYWTGSTWKCDTLALPDEIRPEVPAYRGPFTCMCDEEK